MVLSKSYEEKRDLLTEMLYKRNTVEVAKRSYTYDNLARPVTRVTQREGDVAVTDSFAYNGRGELSNATVNNGAYGYTYDTPSFGTSTTTGNVTQPIQWSSVYYDNHLGLVYYNYRHYNPTDGRWISSRDPIAEQGGLNLYGFVGNGEMLKADVLGRAIFILTALDAEDSLIRGKIYDIPEKGIKRIDELVNKIKE